MSIAAAALGRASALLRRPFSLLWQAEAQFRGARFEGTVTFLGRPILTVAQGSSMVFGGENNIFSARRCNPLGIAQPTVIRTLAPGARLVLGRGVGMSGAVVCAGLEIEIGEGTILGSGAMVIDNDFHRPDGEWGWADEYVAQARPICIGRGCFIGARAIILKGVTIGDRATIGAGAVVTKDVPAGAIAAGNPARVVSAPPLSSNSQQG